MFVPVRGWCFSSTVLPCGRRAGCYEDERHLLEALPTAMQSALAVDLNFSIVSEVALFKASAFTVSSGTPRALGRVCDCAAVGRGRWRHAAGCTRDEPDGGLSSAQGVTFRCRLTWWVQEKELLCLLRRSSGVTGLCSLCARPVLPCGPVPSDRDRAWPVSCARAVGCSCLEGPRLGKNANKETFNF